MPSSKCPKCDSISFELVLKNDVHNSNVAFWFIQCSSCGCVVGVSDFDDTAQLVRKLAKKMNLSLD